MVDRYTSFLSVLYVKRNCSMCDVSFRISFRLSLVFLIFQFFFSFQPFRLFYLLSAFLLLFVFLFLVSEPPFSLKEDEKEGKTKVKSLEEYNKLVFTCHFFSILISLPVSLVCRHSTNFSRAFRAGWACIIRNSLDIGGKLYGTSWLRSVESRTQHSLCASRARVPNDGRWGMTSERLAMSAEML